MATSAERDAYDDMLDNDPEVRAQVKAELKRLATVGYQGVQQTRQPQQRDRIDEIRDEIKQNDAWLDAFFEKEKEERDYNEYERRRRSIEKLEREKRDLAEQRQHMQRQVQNSTQLIDRWIDAQKAANPKVAKYADLIRQEARALRPDVLADQSTLLNALANMIEPRAYKAWRENEERKNRAAQTDARRDTASGDAYTDEGDDVAEQKQGKFADASAEERQFLKGIGVIKDDRQQSENPGLIMTDKGEVIIPIGRGRRNEPR